MKRTLMTIATAAVLVSALSACSKAPEQTAAAGPKIDATQIGTDAYVYAYPLVTMEISRRVITNVAEPAGTRGPMGHLIKLRGYPDAKFRDVTAPNADTLYTTAWLDVSKEPWYLGVPDAKGRYHLLPMLDGWTNVFEVPGTRTTGNGAGKFAITGPGWKGTLPEGVKELKSPTGIVWLLGRIYCTGTPEDYKATHAMQDAFELMPLSNYGKPYKPAPGQVDPSIDMKTPVRDQVHALSAQAYFTMFAELLKTNPPVPADAPMVEALAKIGIVPGQSFDWAKLEPEVQTALNAVPKAAQAKIMENFKSLGQNANGWIYSTKLGVYGTEYLNRATTTAIGLGANRPQDAIYPTSEAAADGQPYDGANKYVMHFEKGQMPPAEGFWSLTMYDGSYFFVDNPLNRYNVSSRSKFVANADGSVDVYIQKDNPGKAKEANWLPAPAGKFILMLRLYWPREKAPSILDDSWKIPEVKKVVPLP